MQAMMFRNMATIILEDYARYYSEVDKDALAKYLEETFNNHVGQIKWERDVAMKQLEEHAIPFGCKADVQAVVHGEWNMGESGVVYFCSRCRCAAHPRESERWHYCPKCGAKMDGKVSE